MATFQERVEQYIGAFSDTQALSDWLSAGARLHIKLLPPSEREKYSTIITDNGSGITVQDMIVLSADKNGYESRPFPASVRGRLADQNSVFYATANTPAHYIYNGKLYILPGGGTAQVIGFPDVTYSDSDITTLPADLEDATVIYAALQAMQKITSDAINNITIDVTMPTAPTLKVYPSVPVISINGVSFSTPSIGVLPTAPSYQSQTVSLPSAPAILDIDMSGAVAPSSPSLSSMPTYSNPSKPIISNLYSDAETAIGDDDFEKAASIMNEVSVKLREYQADIEEAIGQFNAEVNAYVADNRTDIDKYQADIAKYQADVNKLVQEYQSNLEKEIKLYQIESEVVLKEYSAKIQNAVAAFNASNASYQREVDRLIEQARITLQSEIESLTTVQQKDIEQARIDLQLYAQNAQAVSQENATLINQFAQEVQAKATEVSVEMQASVEKSNQMIAMSQSLRGEYQTILSPYLSAK